MLADRGQFHIRPSAVGDHVQKAKIANIVKKWAIEHQQKIQPRPDFPKTVMASNPCSAECCRTQSGLDSSRCQHLSEQICFILMACASKQDGVDPTVLLMFVAMRVLLFVLVGHCQYLSERNSQAELLSFQPVEAVDFVEDLDLPLELKMQTGATVAGFHWPDINDEQIV